MQTFTANEAKTRSPAQALAQVDFTSATAGS